MASRAIVIKCIPANKHVQFHCLKSVSSKMEAYWQPYCMNPLPRDAFAFSKPSITLLSFPHHFIYDFICGMKAWGLHPQF